MRGAAGNGIMQTATSHIVSRKKSRYPISDFLASYLRSYGRIQSQGIRYSDLSHYSEMVPVYDQEGQDTHWATVFYTSNEQREIHRDLLVTYALLRSDGDLSGVKDLYVDRIDLCLYGNTLPYRVRIVNALNENFDYYYVKITDANRVYGLELEHILSPSRIHYYVYGDTTVEEHIIGIPGDVFIKNDLPSHRFNRVRLAKQFVKFDQRCLVRLLGDMHSGNFVVDVRRDFEKYHFLFRPIDFDQQSHHRKKMVYCPQEYPRNAPFREIVHEELAPDSILQYQREERALIERRVRVSHRRFDGLMEVMCEDIIADDESVAMLGAQLASHYADARFERCMTMGDLVSASIERLAGTEIGEEATLGDFIDWQG